jgi:hypothetical protein
MTVELVFSSGEIYSFPYVAVANIDGVQPTSQEHLFELMEIKLFA